MFVLWRLEYFTRRDVLKVHPYGHDSFLFSGLTGTPQYGRRTCGLPATHRRGGRSGCCSPRGVVKMLLGACGAQTPSRPCFQLLAACTQRRVAGSHADATCKFFRNCQTVFQYFFLSHLDRGARRRDGGSFLAHGGVLGGQKPAQRGVCPPDCPSGYSPCFSFAWKLTQPSAISEAGVSFPFSVNSGVHHVEAWGCGPLHLLDTQARENWRDYVPQFPHP